MLTAPKASGRLKTTCLGFQWEREAPAELGFGSAGASPSRYNGNCRSPKRKNSLALAPRCCVGKCMGYNASMTTSTALHQLFDSVGNCLSLEAASKLRELRVTDELQSQLDSWATRNSEGVLEAEERQQYEAILRALNFVAVLQAKARHIAEESSGS